MAEKIKKSIKSVDKEIRHAQKEYLEIKATDFDLPAIVSNQEALAKKYGKKLKHIDTGKEFNHDKS